MQLYKLADNYRNSINELDSLLLEGDIDQDSYNDTLEGIEGEVEDKCINVGLHIKNLRSDIEQLVSVQKEYAARAKSVQSQLDFYERYLDNNMQKSGITELKSDYCDLKYKKMPDIVDVLDAENLPGEYIVTKTTTSPDKRALKKALDSGESITGAELVTGRTKLEIK